MTSSIKLEHTHFCQHGWRRQLATGFERMLVTCALRASVTLLRDYGRAVDVTPPSGAHELLTKLPKCRWG